MTPFLPLLAARDGFGDIAQLLIFMILAIGGAIQHVLKKRAEERRRRAETGPREHEAQHTPRGVPPRPPPRPPLRPPQRRPQQPVPAQAERPPQVPVAARVQTSPLSAHGLAQPGHGGRVVILADPKKRAQALSGRRLLFATAPTRHDRFRAAVLWHEVLGPPPALGE
jgi:hypothetical protein